MDARKHLGQFDAIADNRCFCHPDRPFPPHRTRRRSCNPEAAIGIGAPLTTTVKKSSSPRSDSIEAIIIDSKERGITVDRLSFSFPNRPLFSKFSLRTTKRRIVLKGPSGCGKTTLLKLLFGSLPVNDQAVVPAFIQPIMVLQEDALFPWLTGRANIERFRQITLPGLEQHPLYPVVAEFIDRRVHQMSYGQRRAVELFRALLVPPDALFLDEPFNYLDDTKTTAFIEHLLSSEWADVLVLITTHRHDTSLDAASEVFSFDGEPPFANLTRVR